MITGFLIELEDNGQDFLSFETDGIGTIIETKPFQGGIWNGGFIPVFAQRVGELCMMHKLPEFDRGFLKHRVTKITELTDDHN